MARSAYAAFYCGDLAYILPGGMLLAHWTSDTSFCYKVVNIK